MQREGPEERTTAAQRGTSRPAIVIRGRNLLEKKKGCDYFSVLGVVGNSRGSAALQGLGVVDGSVSRAP